MSLGSRLLSSLMVVSLSLSTLAFASAQATARVEAQPPQVLTGAAVVKTMEMPEQLPENILRDLRVLYPTYSEQELNKFAVMQSTKQKKLEEFAANNHFAGAYSASPSGEWTVLATDAATAKEFSQQATDVGVPSKAEVVHFSYTELEDARQTIEGIVLGATKDNYRLGVDVASNSVLLQVESAVLLQTLRTLMPSNLSKLVRLETVDMLPEVSPASCNSRFACGRPARGGTSLGTYNGSLFSSSCSLGFVTRADGGSYWLYTAGHCFTPTQVNNRQNIGHSGQVYGYLRDRRDSGAVDVIRARIENSYWLGGNFGFLFNNTTSVVNVDYAIVSAATIQEGQVVCFQGYNLEVGDDRCGVVTGENVNGLLEIDGVKVCSGDSGGSVYSFSSNRRWAYGILSGSSERREPGNCTGNGTGQMYYSPLPSVNAWMDGLTSPGDIRVVIR